MKGALSYILRSAYFKGAALVLLLVALVGAPLALTHSAQPRDCDGNAVMTCGAYSKNEFNKKTKEQNLTGVYGHYGITEEKINSGEVVDGYVTKDGQIVADGKVYGENSWSMGRHYMANSIKRDVAGQEFWYRPTQVSFRSSSLAAFVNVKEGWAVIKTCGNVVISESKPFGLMFKQVANVSEDAEQFYAADTKETAVDAKLGDTLKYKVMVTNGGYAPMTNVVIKDSLPAGVELVSNPNMRLIEHRVSGRIEPGKTKYILITVRVTDDALRCVVNKSTFTADDDQKGEDTAVICQPQDDDKDKDQDKPKDQDDDKDSDDDQDKDEDQDDDHDDDKDKDDNKPKDQDDDKDGQDEGDDQDDDRDDGEGAGDDKNGDDRAKDEQLPKQLATTGPAEAAAGLMASGGLGVGLKGYIRSRRNLHEALLNR